MTACCRRCRLRSPSKPAVPLAGNAGWAITAPRGYTVEGYGASAPWQVDIEKYRDLPPKTWPPRPAAW